MSELVIDANILIKLFRWEADTETSRDFLQYVIQQGIQIIAPQLLVTETMDVCIAKGVDGETLVDFFEAQLESSLLLVDLSPPILRKAAEMAKTGHPKSGYPGLNDCIYHAVAIAHGSVLITADQRHYKKARQFGHIALLGDWKSVVGDL